MNGHPVDSIPAFVLGALDPDEALQVGLHLTACQECRAEADTFRASVDALAYAAPDRAPPARVKAQLFARIAAGQADQPAPKPAARPPWSRAMAGVAALALAMALLFGFQLAAANRRVAELAGQLAASERAVVDLRAQLAQEQLAAVFIAAPQTVARRLDSPDRRASAAMYMQPDNTRAVLVVQGLPQARAGTVYQFWLARPGVQVAANTFHVDGQGNAMLTIDAPTPVNQYDQVMVTVERDGGSSSPSDQVVLSGSLAVARLVAARPV